MLKSNFNADRWGGLFWAVFWILLSAYKFLKWSGICKQINVKIGSGCDTVDSVVTFDIRRPGF